MDSKLKIVLGAAAAVAALSSGTLYAQSDKPQTGMGMMMQGSGGDMRSMMHMMGQMHQMMETCNKMMQGMGTSQGQDKPAPKSQPQNSK